MRITELSQQNSAECFNGNIEELTHQNTMYRKVLFTSENMQLVVMSIPVGEEIGAETHTNGAQFIRVESGVAKFVLGGEESKGRDGYSVVIPAGVEHNVINIGEKPLQLYAIYSPPEHPAGTEQQSKP